MVAKDLCNLSSAARFCCEKVFRWVLHILISTFHNNMIIIIIIIITTTIVLFMGLVGPLFRLFYYVFVVKKEVLG